MSDKDTALESRSTTLKSRARRWAIAGLGAASVAAVTVGAGWHGDADALGPGHRGGFMGHGFGAGIDPEAMERRIDGMVAFMLADIDSTPDQQSRISAIARQAAADLAPLRGMRMEARRKSFELLAQPTIDRTQLEALRVQQMQLGETVSRRMVQAIADAAEVLTPEQRARLAEKWQARRHPRAG